MRQNEKEKGKEKLAGEGKLIKGGLKEEVKQNGGRK